MPRKIRDYRSDLIELGFSQRKGKGSHQNWKHPKLPLIITIAFQDGDDVPRYLEKLLTNAQTLLSQLDENP
jgi:predicted RNA binding protein YcfA (HicA-like mRNA interferase family)